LCYHVKKKDMGMENEEVEKEISSLSDKT